MPGYKTHILFAVLTSALLLYLLNTELQAGILCIAIAGLYSLLPDIDISSSKARRLFVPLIISMIIIAILLRELLTAVLMASILLIVHLLHHRGFIHSITSGFFMSIPLYFYNPLLFIFAFWAYGSHLLLDRKIKLI